MRPVVISHGASSVRADRSRFRLEFDWTGTSDPTAYLAVPQAIEVVGGALPGGWPAVMARNRALALETRRQLCAVAGTTPPCPDAMIGSLAAVPLPDSLPTTVIGWRQPDPIQARLFDAWGIEVPVITFPAAPKRLVRISAQLYNTREQFAHLAEALGKELAAERRA